MNTKNLISRSVKRVNGFTIQDLAIDLVELSEKDLQHIVGGFELTDSADCHCHCHCCCPPPPPPPPPCGCPKPSSNSLSAF